MTPLVLGLLVGAALMHASWNALLKGSGDPLQVSARAMATASLWLTPVVAAAWFLSGRPGLPVRGWGLAACSGAVEVAYFVFLSHAYRRGDLSQVYPVARGTAPLLSVAIGLLLLGERLRPPELVGVLFLVLGIWVVRPPKGRRDALWPAIVTGVTIATYSAIDRVGVRLGPPWLYGWGLWVSGSVILLAVTRFRQGDRPIESPEWRRSIVIGILNAATYLLVLVALSLAPLTLVAPVRESAIVLVTAWGLWRLQERERAWLRMAGAAIMVAGIALVALGG